MAFKKLFRCDKCHTDFDILPEYDDCPICKFILKIKLDIENIKTKEDYENAINSIENEPFLDEIYKFHFTKRTEETWVRLNG